MHVTRKALDSLSSTLQAMTGTGSSEPKTAKDGNSGVGTIVREMSSNPDILLKRSEDLTSKCRAILAQVYAQQSAAVHGPRSLELQFAPTKKQQGYIPLGPLIRIETGPVYDSEQLWEEVEMRNDPCCRYLRNSVKEQKSAYERQINVANDKAKLKKAAELEAQKVPAVGILKRPRQNQTADTANGISDDDSASPQKSKVRFAGLEDEEENSLSGSEEESDGKEETQEKNSKSSTPVGLEDGFFNLADMEAFAEEAENLALDGRLMGSDDEDGSEDDDAEAEALNSGNTGSEKRLRYDEFFDRPANQNMGEDNARALRRANLFDQGSDEDSEGDAEEQTPLERSRAHIRKTIESMEDAAVAKKPWELRGEVPADGRPKNSALDANFEHDIGFQNRAAFAPRSAEAIEEIIKQRIHDRLFDDVVRSLPQEYEDAKKSKKDIPEVSQEKPTEGLAELYEKEYIEQREKLSKAAEAANVVEKEEGPEETEMQKEVNKLFSRLCTKLDALTSLHFTPTQLTMPEEMTVKPNVPALAAEEAIPEAVSDAALLAPNEVHKAKKQDSHGDLEKNKVDRRRNRRATKKRLSSLTKERTVVQAQKEQADPILAEKRRAERALERRGKKIKPSKKSDLATKGRKPKTGDFSKSNRFFSNLQDTISAEITAKKQKSDVGETRQKSAAELKL